MLFPRAFATYPLFSVSFMEMLSRPSFLEMRPLVLTFELLSLKREYDFPAFASAFRCFSEPSQPNASSSFFLFLFFGIFRFLAGPSSSEELDESVSDDIGSNVYEYWCPVFDGIVPVAARLRPFIMVLVR